MPPKKESEVHQTNNDEDFSLYVDGAEQSGGRSCTINATHNTNTMCNQAAPSLFVPSPAAQGGKSTLPQFIPASKTLLNQLYYNRRHPVQCCHIACSFCGRWSLERFYTEDEVKLELIRHHPAVKEVLQLAGDTVYGAELLKGANISSLLFSSMPSSAGKSESSNTPLGARNPIEKAFLELSQLSRAENTEMFNTTPVTALSGIQKRYLSRHVEHCIEMEQILNNHGIQYKQYCTNTRQWRQKECGERGESKFCR